MMLPMSAIIARPLAASATLIDDVITRGAQMLGGAWRIWAV
jgi:hypothetical protein